jgi:sugar phosphate isomerase/epimerase
MYSRRDFGKIALASVPMASALAASNGVILGVMTYSYRTLPVVPGTDRVNGEIEALKANGSRDIELYEQELQPPGKPDELAKWRAATQLETLRAKGNKLAAAGVKTHAYTVNYQDVMTDADLDRTFEQAKALGTSVIAASTHVSMAKRLVPFAEKHKIYVAFHGHSNTKDPNEFSSPESFERALDLSKYFKVNLDIGHFFAAGFDPVAYIQEHHDRVSHLHVKDRKKNDGPNLAWGEGDTPIKQVLLLLKDKQYPIPALVEWEYSGKGTVVEEVQRCLDYMQHAVA